VVEVSGDFEIHLGTTVHHVEQLVAWAADRGVDHLDIVIDSWKYVSRPVVTVASQGTLSEQDAALRRWQTELRAAAIPPHGWKLKAAPSCAGVPQSDEDAAAEPDGRYFEHHLRLRLPGFTVAALLALTDLVAPHDAVVSRDTRREAADGVQERFVYQRCYDVGLASATRRLDELVATVRAAGYEIAASWQHYVVFNDDQRLEPPRVLPRPGTHNTWFDKREERMRSAPAGALDYPPTYQPLPASQAVRQRAAFDPATQHYQNSYRPGEPTFGDAATGQRWVSARRTAINRILTAIAASTWREQLVLRGSVTMAAWIGAAAREPGDIDFVVTPHTITSGSPEATALLAGLKAAVRTVADAGLRPDQITESAIWTYERADGRRLVVPLSTPDTPDGRVQLDVVFGERLPLDPEVVLLSEVDGPLLAASAPLSLAWKLLWLSTDMYPQGKDLYDAVLLAEHTTVDRALVRDLIRPELGDFADTFTAESVLSWAVDWSNFTDEYEHVTGTRDAWLRRLALALDHGWR
jgi:hypothetical protein